DGMGKTRGCETSCKEGGGLELGGLLLVLDLGRNEPFPPRFSTFSNGYCRAPVSASNRETASLSVAAGAYHTRLSAWRFVGRYRAPDGSMAVRAVRPAVCLRESPGRW